MVINLNNYNIEFKQLTTKKNTLNTRKLLSNNLQNYLNDNNLTLKEAYYLWKNNINIIPICPVCGKRLHFNGKTYNKYCSIECKKKDISSIVEKMKQTNIKKYGADNPLKNKEIRQKAIDTSYKHFGTTHPMLSNEIKDKIKKTNIEKYSVENPAQSDIIKNKTAQTNLQRYGNKCSLHSAENEIKRKTALLERYGDENYNNIEKHKNTCLEKYGVDSTRKLQWNEEKRKETVRKQIEEYEKENNVTEVKKLAEIYKGHWINVVDPILYKARLFVKNSDIQKIKDYCDNPKSTSNEEKEIVSFIKSIYDGDVIENDRQIIKPKELDIYIPEKKVAIEFDGLFWHSSYCRDDNYMHLKKTKMCEQKRIRLIHIFEDEWLQQKDIVQSLIKSSLGIYNKKYMARKLKVEQISFIEAKDFFNKNHIQGYAAASLFYGLKDNGELIQAISVGKNRFTKDKHYELIRMCTKLNCQVVGGFSRLIKHLMKDLDIKEIESYVDRRLFDAKGYLSSGWQKIGESKPRCFYTDFKSRENRQTYMKKACLKKWPDSDPTMTEEELTKAHGLYQIYDCGTIKVKLNNKIQQLN